MERTFDNLVPRAYDLSETTPAGWRLEGATCSDGSNPANVAVAPGEDVICTFMPETTGEFRIVLRKPGPYIDTNLELKIEHGEGFPAGKLEELAEQLKRTIKEKLVFTPVVEMVPPGTLPRSEYKIEYFERLYEDEGSGSGRTKAGEGGGSLLRGRGANGDREPGADKA